MPSTTDEAPDAIPFREWMQRALFDPQSGYYSRHVRGVGRHGDFSTSATISTALGEAIAHWLREERQRFPKIKTIIEIGGGDGSLMRAVRRALGFIQRWRLQFFMVESSPVLTAKQKETLGASKAKWFSDLRQALDACDGCAIIFHNELLDAFPVSLIEWSPSLHAWQEVCLVREATRWREQLRPLDLPAEKRPFFSALDREPSQAQRCELGTAAREWLHDWSPHWREGAMLTLDYGDTFPQLYHRRPQGTLRAYLAHQTLSGSDVYQNMGRQDITADVNFTDLLRWGAALGWTSDTVRSQRDFLLQHLRHAEARAQSDAALRFLLDEHGAGGAFRTLVQRRAS
jgi:SAM-dependent MidA family methyltransferase